MTRNNMTEC